ncbi:hypothetical protein PanWU01x14_207420 [Parasponia andersonii]|uniref:Uncharacterized protein n=1 Tax=Parasponia andersonii TaxID=3476 RepID=A0A2P5BV24_PARAD|nr:hypothetical protein PanWU01x14_207420 [Parasponia andersonii]
MERQMHAALENRLRKGSKSVRWCMRAVELHWKAYRDSDLVAARNFSKFVRGAARSDIYTRPVSLYIWVAGRKCRSIPNMFRSLILGKIAYSGTTLSYPGYFYLGFRRGVILKKYSSSSSEMLEQFVRRVRAVRQKCSSSSSVDEPSVQKEDWVGLIRNGDEGTAAIGAFWENGVRVPDFSEFCSFLEFRFWLHVFRSDKEEDTRDLERGDLESDGSSINSNHRFYDIIGSHGVGDSLTASDDNARWHSPSEDFAYGFSAT